MQSAQHASPGTLPQERARKSFLLLFFKKEVFASLLAPRRLGIYPAPAGSRIHFCMRRRLLHDRSILCGAMRSAFAISAHWHIRCAHQFFGLAHVGQRRPARKNRGNSNEHTQPHGIPFRSEDIAPKHVPPVPKRTFLATGWLGRGWAEAHPAVFLKRTFPVQKPWPNEAKTMIAMPITRLAVTARRMRFSNSGPGRMARRRRRNGPK